MSVARPRDVPPPRRGVRRRARQRVLRALLGPQARLRHGGGLRPLPRALHARRRRRARRAVRARPSTTTPSAASPTSRLHRRRATWASRPSTSATRSPTPRAERPSRSTARPSACARPASSRPTRPTPRAGRASRRRAWPPPTSISTRCSTASGGAATISPRSLGYPNYMELYSEVKGLDYGLLRAELEGFLQRHGGPLRARHGPSRPRAPRHHARRAHVRRPALPVARPGLRPRLHRRRPGAHARATRSRPGHRSRRPDQRAPRHRGPRAQVAAGLLRAGARARRDLPGRPASRRPGRLRARCCTRPGTPSTSRTSSPDLPFEYRHLGDNAVTEAFAFIFDHLVVNRRWLDVAIWSSPTPTTSCASPASTTSTSCAATPPSSPTRPSCTRRPATLDGMAGEYSRRLSEATWSTCPTQSYLTDVDDGFYCASYLRAWMLEGALRMMLQDRYGMDWFANDAAGDLAQGAVVRRPALHRRAAAAQARRRASRHRPAAAPLRARPGPLRPGALAGQRAASTLTSTRRRRGPSNSAK